MKKTLIIFLSLISLISFTCSSCSNQHDDYVVPDKYRNYRYDEFNNFNETENFIFNLRKANKNGNFHFLIPEFTIKDNYEYYKFKFFGQIEVYFPRDKDIYNSTYRFFNISFYSYRSNVEMNGKYEFYINALPFYFDISNFDKSKIEYSIFNNEYIDFTYDGYTILELKIYTNNIIVDFDINEFISDTMCNLKLIV